MDDVVWTAAFIWASCAASFGTNLFALQDVADALQRENNHRASRSDLKPITCSGRVEQARFREQRWLATSHTDLLASFLGMSLYKGKIRDEQFKIMPEEDQENVSVDTQWRIYEN